MTLWFLLCYRIVDSIQECCNCNDSAICISTVNLINDLLTSIEQLVKGQGLTNYMIREIHTQYKELEGKYFVCCSSLNIIIVIKCSPYLLKYMVQKNWKIKTNYSAKEIKCP